MSNYAFGTLSNDRMSGVHKDLQMVARRALRISSTRKDGGVDFAIPQFGGLRTAEDQNGLFKKKVSNADGYNKKSYHQTGLALDIIPYVKVEGIKGNAIYSKRISKQKRDLLFHMVATCMLQAANELRVKLRWGGNFRTFQDSPHFEIIK